MNMASAIEILWKQALKTFDGRRNVGFKLCQKNFDKLWNLMNKITAEDVNLNKQVLDFIQIQSAPMCVIDIFENKDLTISIFILKHGVTMPMHDHPGMHGFLKVISGAVQVNSYTLKTNDDHIIKSNKEIDAFRHRPISLHNNSPACVLTPRDKNLHEISCIEGPAAFLDILSPPYDEDDSGNGPRPCTYFKTISSTSCMDLPDIVEEVKLLAFEGPPNFDSESLKYTGPPLM
ncbi:2-aminoethanethiol dioxygenase [Megalopta genalis]|uniref:2-aminoethanethiol dioxygenase n=1 Tax=Megalopta genalis TaxID=115081 RepID=UPI0014433470|nr:2-aminoethanethiol dioxygenase [Megalopta genalis]XP_033322656.1 2-aminoethanethiol dioxygenase [Megalopta genalis]XP_033322657.1 2-aminoethanethiol dioxygenase [Megalopta genalis]